MVKNTGKFDRIVETTLFRYQQAGFLRGDYVTIKKDALRNEAIKPFSSQMKSLIDEAIKGNKTFRVSYIKSGKAEAIGAPLDAPNVPGYLWADIYEEYGPGMWKNIMTLPLEVLEKKEVDEVAGYAPYDKKLIRPNTAEHTPEKELLDQTKGGDSERQLPKKNTKLGNTKQPKDGRKGTTVKENANMKGIRAENDLIFESYIKEYMDEGEGYKAETGMSPEERGVGAIPEPDISDEVNKMEGEGPEPHADSDIYNTGGGVTNEINKLRKIKKMNGPEAVKAAVAKLDPKLAKQIAQELIKQKGHGAAAPVAAQGSAPDRGRTV